MCAIRSQQQNPRSTTEYIDQYNVVQDELNECNNSASDYWQTSKKAELKDAQVSDSVISVVYTCKWKQSSIRPAWTEISHMNVELKTYWSQWDRLELKDEILYRKWRDMNLNTQVLKVVLSFFFAV